MRPISDILYRIAEIAEIFAYFLLRRAKIVRFHGNRRMARRKYVSRTLEDLELESFYVYLHEVHLVQFEFVRHGIERPDVHFFDADLFFACVRKKRVGPPPVAKMELRGARL